MPHPLVRTVIRACAVRLFLPLLLLLLAVPRKSRAQDESAAPQSSITVFLDCNFRCDGDYIHTEIDYVNWVRDRAAADVQVLGTAQQTGSGGRDYTLAFIGLRAFDGMTDTLHYVSASTATNDDVRRGLVHVLQTGLVRFIARTAIADRLTISVAAGGANAAPLQTQHDPWHSWVFRTQLNVNANGDENNTFRSLNGSVRARRVTDLWKVEFTARENYNESKYTIDGERSTFIRRSHSLDELAVRSVGPRAAVGVRGFVGQSTFDNKRLDARVQPAVEFDLFPYDEATRRSLTLQYAVGVEAFRYIDTTVYGKTRETHPLHSLTASLSQNQPWGSLHLQLEGGQFLDLTNKNYARGGGNLSVRVFEGFNVDVGGHYETIRNQLFLPAVGATPEEILTQQRQLATGYQYDMYVGLSYTFGSLLNNVVNSRFPQS